MPHGSRSARKAEGGCKPGAAVRQVSTEESACTGRAMLRISVQTEFRLQQHPIHNRQREELPDGRVDAHPVEPVLHVILRDEQLPVIIQ